MKRHRRPIELTLDPEEIALLDQLAQAAKVSRSRYVGVLVRHAVNDDVLIALNALVQAMWAQKNRRKRA